MLLKIRYLLRMHESLPDRSLLFRSCKRLILNGGQRRDRTAANPILEVVWNFLSTLFSSVGHERLGRFFTPGKPFHQQQSSLPKYLFQCRLVRDLIGESRELARLINASVNALRLKSRSREHDWKVLRALSRQDLPPWVVNRHIAAIPSEKS